jgi:hypothetical protein
MNDISIVALFCDDIREEIGGTTTIVGVLPDNLSVSEIPGIFPKLCVYVRMHLRSDLKPGPIVTRVLTPDGQEVGNSVAEPHMLADVLARAQNSGAPYAGLVMRFFVSPLQITQIGRIQALVSVGDKEHVAGVLNIGLLSPAT